MRKIVVTGATGMIGATLVRYAVKKQIRVLCIVRKDTERLDNLPKSNLVGIKYCDMNNYLNFYLDESYDVFFHFAWEKTSGDSRDDVDIQLENIKYTLDAVRLAKRLKCRKFIGAGSQAEYGLSLKPLGHDLPTNPESGYGVAKYSASKFSGLLCKQLELEFNWVRILSVFGLFDASHTLITYVVDELRAGRSPELTKCEQVWDYLYCDDAARAFLDIGDSGINGSVYTLGSGKYKKLSEYVEIIRDIISPNTELLFGRKEYYPHQPMYLCANISELSRDTGWIPQISFEDGIRKIIAADKSAE